MVGRLNSAEAAFTSKVAREVLRPSYIVVARGREGGPRTRRALNLRLQIPLSIPPRAIKPMGGEVDVRIYSDACVAWYREDFVARSTGKAHDRLTQSLAATNDIYGLELFPIVATAPALWNQLGGKRIIISPGIYAAARSLVEVSSRAPAVLALSESFWRTATRAAATCLI